MNRPIDWQTIAAPLDVQGFDISPYSLRRWLGYERVQGGVLFFCEMEGGKGAVFRVDVVADDIVRVRMSLDKIRETASELLVPDALAWQPASFEIRERENCLILTTSRLRLEFPRFPWHMQVWGLHDRALPFFSQRCDDRAYGRFYEVPPPGFDENADGRLTARESIAVTPGESFYGFGEKFTPLDKWGQELISWAVDSGNVSSQRSYKNVPFFMSTAGYGLFVHTGYPIVYRLGTESSISCSIHVDDDQLDYFLIYGPAFKEILRRYTDLTGRAPVPPRWSFGFWLSRAGYRSRSQVEAIVAEMRARDFPCDVINLDPWWMGDCAWCTYEWDTDAFPRPEEMIRHLREQGVRTCLWITPYVAAGSRAYDEGLAGGYFLRRADGSLSPVIETFSGQDLAAIDFTNPQAVAWFQSKLETLLDMGVAVFKSDFGEQAPLDAIYHDGRSGLEMHNLYPLLYNRAVFELTERYYGRGLTWGRSGYAGSQRYPVQWGGDSYSCLDQMACQLRGLLSYGMSGVPFCSHDVGGFDYPPAAFDRCERDGPWFLKGDVCDPVVYARWLQFGVFSSHVRAHGKQPREPWEYGPEVEAIARRYLKLRYRLLPYIYSQAVKSSQTGLPMVRPMVLEFQDDPTTHRLDLQYMFGDHFLVAPVVRRDNRCRVYLPAGEWLDYWTREVMSGPRWLELEVPLEVLPVWVRAGAIIPLGPEMTHTEEKPLDPLTLEFYRPQGDGQTTVYDEDRADIPVRYTRQGDQLTVEVGATPGQVEIVLYGVPATSASLGGKALTLHRHPGGQLVRVEGIRGATVTFELV